MNSKILVVDDSILNIRILTDILESNGAEVFPVENGLAVLGFVDQFKPDVVLLDIILPGLDGFEVCRQLKEDPDFNEIPVIMVTAKTDGQDIKRALDLGAFDYIKKPLDEIEVIARVESALRYKKQQDRLKEMAMKDGLTGIYNRIFLMEILENELRKSVREGNNISFVMIDIDYFKKVNDTYGHQTGDFVLKGLAKIIESFLHKGEIVGRYGGEEFGIVLPHLCIDNIKELCERIRINVENFGFDFCEETIHITVSMGICFKKADHPIIFNEMIKEADEALYKAKRNGRNRFEISLSGSEFLLNFI